MIRKLDFARFDTIDTVGGDDVAAVVCALNPAFFAEVPQVEFEHLARAFHECFNGYLTKRRLLWFLTTASVEQAKKLVTVHRIGAGLLCVLH